MRASEMRKGQTVKVDGKLYAIVDYQHVKLGKGGAVYQTKLKSLMDGSIQNVRLRAEENVEEAYLDKRNYEYLYSSGSEHVLMDTEMVVTLPNTVDLEVTDTPPEIKGATATNQNKPATLETGLVVQVPPFIKLGELIRVDTRTGEYVTRVKE